MWTKNDEDFLRQNKHLSNSELASSLNKSNSSIRSKKHRLGLKRTLPIGYKNNKLRLIDETFTKKVGQGSKSFGLFICDCGKMTEKRVSSVTSGLSKTCGQCVHQTDGVNLLI